MEIWTPNRKIWTPKRRLPGPRRLFFEGTNSGGGGASVAGGGSPGTLAIERHTAFTPIPRAYEVATGRKYLEGFVRPGPALTALENFGASIGVILTNTAVGVSDGSDAGGVAAEWGTGAVIGNLGAVEQNAFPASVWERQANIYCALRVKFTTSVEQRFWFGWTTASATTMLATDDPAGENLIMFRASPGAGAVNYDACAKDGVTLNAVDTGIAHAAGGAFFTLLEILINPLGNPEFYIDGVLVATLTANLPALTTQMGNFMFGLSTKEASEHLWRTYWYRASSD